MGCTTSMDMEQNVNDRGESQENNANYGLNRAVNVVQEFVRLDVQIGKLEQFCPGSRLGTIDAWHEHLKAKRDSMLGVDGVTSTYTTSNNKGAAISAIQTATHDNQLPNRGNLATVNRLSLDAGAFIARQTHSDIVAKTPSKDLANLALNLGVIDDKYKASTHEDFFANLSESALFLTRIRYYTEILNNTAARQKLLKDSYAELNELYFNHDNIIAYISGGTYISRLEESLDAQLEVARDVRNKLAATCEQWRVNGALLHSAANSATQGFKVWKQLPNIVHSKEKISMALDCRHNFHTSLIALECAQMVLPNLEIKYISNRQTLAVNHCNTYMITDLSDPLRYEHASKVFSSYESNISKASTWIFDTFNKSLKKDFEKSEETVKQFAKTLRDHREEIFSNARK